MKSLVNEQSGWPIGAILGYGTFGSHTPAGRRYHRRSGIALTTLLVWMFVVASLDRSTLRHVTPLVPGVVFLYVIYEFRQYLRALDELARRMHMEALSWTYLTGLALAMLVGGISATVGWHVNPMWFIVPEPVRAGFLFVVSRRY